MLKKDFETLVLKYAASPAQAENLWVDLEAAYTSEDRHYHNLQHLEQLLQPLLAVKEQVQDWDCLLFAVYYHHIFFDVVQYVLANDNEDKSAEKTATVLRSLQVPEEKITRCKHHIMATKRHELSGDGDTNFLTDADLSILGQPWPVYEVYMKNIRKEFEIYHDHIFNTGRLKALKHLLQFDRIYKTPYFNEQFEKTARENITEEIEILSLS